MPERGRGDRRQHQPETPGPGASVAVDEIVGRLASHGMPRVVATDLDGTLLRTDGTASDRTRRAMAAAEEAGLRTVLVTARPPRWLDDLESIVGAHGVALCGNGAFVYDVPSRTVTAEFGFDPEALALVLTDLRRELPGISFAAERASGYGHEDGYTSDHPVPEGAVRGVVDASVGEPVGKLLARHTGIADDPFRAAVADIVGQRGVVAYSGADGLAEISAPGVTKAAGLARWCAALGLAADAVWAFGDMPNDVPMLTWAGTGVAVANAHPEVLAAADVVCPANDDDGVAQVLELIGMQTDH